MKKFFTLLSALLVAATLPAQITWTMFSASEYAGGSGTEDDPYLIATPEQLAKVARDCDSGNDFLGVYFRLTDDLDLGRYYWEPIGGSGSYQETTFWGNIDGAGHSISNLKVSKTASSDMFVAGLISQIEADGSVRNLTIASGEVKGYAFVGSIAALCCGVIENCTNYASVEATASMSGYAGGIAGLLWPSTEGGDPNQRLTECVNYGTVTASNTNGLVAGGIVSNAKGTIERCANLGTVVAGNSSAGGIVGYVSGGDAVTVTDCYNTGDITTGTGLQTGGIVGMVDGSVTVENCYNAGYISSVDKYSTQNGSIVGFALGSSKATLTNCYNDGDVCSLGMVNQSCSPTLTGCNTLDTQRMTSSAFLNILTVASGEGVWAADADGINFGYPVLAFQAQPEEAYYAVSYTVVGEELGEVSVTDKSGGVVKSGDELAEGSVVCLSVTYAEGVKLAVTINGVDEDIDGGVTVEGGACTYYKEITIDGDTDIRIVLDGSGSGIADGKADGGIAVWSHDGAIIVEGEGNPAVSVWTVAGTAVYEGDAASLAGRTFDTGIYMVKAGGECHKVAVR